MDEIEIPAGLIKVDAPDTLLGWALVVPGSPEHRAYVPDEPKAETKPPAKKA